MNEEFEKNEGANIIPIERGIEIRQEKIIAALQKLEREYDFLEERLQGIIEQINQESQTEPDERTDGLLAFLIGQHNVVVGMKKELEKKVEEIEKEEDALLDKDEHLTQQRNS